MNYGWVLQTIIRLLDILFALIGIILALPLILIIAIVTKCDSPGSVFFMQERLGQFKYPFKLIKFRTMAVDAEANGPVWAQEDDSRVTRVGRFLRKSRLDELPQLLNILKGDLSFVGPRPIRACFADLLREHDERYDLRFSVKPGLTGYAQLFAPYGSNVEDQLKKLEFDLRYQHGLSLTAYAQLLCLTVVSVTKGKGV